MPPGIWRFAHLFEDDGEPARRAAARGWTLAEGQTPLQEWRALARELGLDRLLLKREDLNPSGSHKDRGVLYQVVRHHDDRHPRTFVLSSSGNAAVAAGAACRLTGDQLVAFVSPGTAPAKLRHLLESGAAVVETLKPINFARYAARVFGLMDLRGTRDPGASRGYRSLAGELAEEAPDADVILTFSSSGISLEGIADGYAALPRAEGPALWAVQAGECLGIVRALDPGIESEPGNPAGRLGIRNPPHAPALARRLVDTGGGACAVREDAVLSMAARMEVERDLRTSAEGAAVLAAVVDLARARRIRGTVVAVVTGHASQWSHHEDRSPDRHPEQDDAAGSAGLADPTAISLGSYLDVRDWFVSRGHQPL